MNSVENNAHIYNHLPLQPASADIWLSKYRLTEKKEDGALVPLDKDVRGTHHRVATAMASVEKKSERERYYAMFMEAFEMGAIGAGRIMSNAGAEAYKTAVSLINCTVSDTIPDSMEGILEKVKEAGITLKAGCGIGYEFSTLRPRGAHVTGAGASTSGPLSFMEIYDKTCGTVASAGNRRGAQMGTFDIKHPDIRAFIKAKRQDGMLRQFNLSVLITDEFINAVKTQSMWQTEWNGKPFGEPFPAIDLWNEIMQSNYDFAEPGFLLIDRINQYNNLWFTEHLRATNPCGEQPLPPYGSCLLGSINLTMFVIDAFTDKARFDFEKFYRIVRIFTRMLDNVVELNGLPLPQQQHEIRHKRRHGMGFLGLGSMFAMLGIKYGSDESIALTEKISKNLAYAGFEEGAALAKEKGEAPVLKEVFTQDQIAEHLKYNTNFKLKTKRKGDTKEITITGRELFLESHYFDAFKEDEEGLRILALLKKHGCRFSHHSSIAPTGTISLSFGNNASNGIEPTFGHQYTRNVIIEGRNAKQAVNVYSYELLLWRHLVDAEATSVVMSQAEFDAIAEGVDHREYCKQVHKLPPYFITTDELTPKQHVDIQAASQKWIDSSISKTANVPTDITREEFDDVYMYAYSKGLKGCTTFRFNPAAFQGVLVKSSDLQRTLYQFTLADGSTVEVPGDQMVEYEGQTHSAANLFDAIKEGYYGKF